MDNKNKWATVSLEDGMIYEGIIEEETSYGIYFHIGGNVDRLSLWPWHNVTRVLYKYN